MEYTLGLSNPDITIHFGEEAVSSPTTTLTYRPKTIYADIKESEQKLSAFKVLNDKKRFVIQVPHNIPKENLEHILASVMVVLSNNEYKNPVKIVVTHPGNKKNPGIEHTIALLKRVQFARTISMFPGNLGTPKNMAKILQKEFSCKTKILTHTYLYKHGFNLIRAVGESAKNPPCMLVVESIVKESYPTVCILGKGITFDSGGLALKTGSSINFMKYDKLGAVHGAMALAYLVENCKGVNFVGVFPFAENAVSDRAVRPGDVIKSFSGKTVEITDPDAEGRLILADALAYSKKYKPDLIVDIATLTGHAEVINCWHSGYYYALPGENKLIFEEVSEKIGERMLPMPTWSDYSDILKSSVADLVNLPNNGCADSFVAALFLKEFLPEETEWLHIDLAHEYNRNTSLPKGNGMRSIVAFVNAWKDKK